MGHGQVLDKGHARQGDRHNAGGGFSLSEIDARPITGILNGVAFGVAFILAVLTVVVIVQMV